MMARGGLMRAGGLVVVGVVLGRALLGRRTIWDGEVATGDRGAPAPRGDEAPIKLAEVAAERERAAWRADQAEADFQRQLAEAERLRAELRDLGERYAKRDLELRTALGAVDEVRAQIRTLDEHQRAKIAAVEQQVREIDKLRRRENAQWEAALQEHNRQRITENRRMQSLVDEANLLRLVETGRW